jgi:hypothetical protein
MVWMLNGSGGPRKQQDGMQITRHYLNIEFPIWYRKKPMWYRYFRCGIGIFPLRAFSDTTSEIISNRVLSSGKLILTLILITRILRNPENFLVEIFK